MPFLSGLYDVISASTLPTGGGLSFQVNGSSQPNPTTLYQTSAGAYLTYVDPLIVGQFINQSLATVGAGGTLLQQVIGRAIFSYLKTNPDDGETIDYARYEADIIRVEISVDGVSAVPLPPTWPMMIVGFAGLSFMTYRRRSRTVAVAA